MVNRLFVEDAFADILIQGGRDADELRWHKPVRPSDTLSSWLDVVRKEPHNHVDTRGSVDMSITAVDQDGERVVTFTALNMSERRPD